VKQVVRFGAVGGLNTAGYYGLYLLFGLAVPYLVAHVLAFVLSMVGSYFLNCYFTFRVKPSARTFALFPMTNVTNFVVQTVGLYVLVSGFGIDQRVAPLLVAAAAIPVTFLVARFLLTGRVAQPVP
jgi:putative flippase GtrA